MLGVQRTSILFLFGNLLSFVGVGGVKWDLCCWCGPDCVCYVLGLI